jgi:molybdate transport system substrate-binding protein
MTEAVSAAGDCALMRFNAWAIRDSCWNIAMDCVFVLAEPALNRQEARRIDMDAVGRRGLLSAVLGGALALLLNSGLAQTQAQAQGRDVVVFAAASLKNALDAINAQWQKETGKKAAISYAASSALAKQIEQAAPAQMFISADLDWMDYLSKRNLIKPDTRSNLLGNRIVLIAPKDKAQPIDIKPGFELAKVLGDGRLAMANVATVPAGKYGKAALEKLGVWSSVSSKLAQAENVRAALLLVSRGEAPAGIVYQTDAASDSNVKIIGTFPGDTHPPLIYPIALTANATHPDAAAFFAYIRSDKAKRLFEAQGFTVFGSGRS